MADRPWIKQYPEGISWDVDFEARPLYCGYDEAAREFPDRPHLYFKGRSFTYGETSDLVDRAAFGFQQMGVRKGVKVGLYLPNCPQSVICYYAILKAGGIVVNFSPLYSERELVHQVQDSDTEIMVTLNVVDLFPKMEAVLEATSLRKIVACTLAEVLPLKKRLLLNWFGGKRIADVPEDDQHVMFLDLVNNDGRHEPAIIDPYEDIAVLQYTGGTTGVPKGAMLTHANICANVQQMRAWDQTLKPGDGAVLAVLPFFHVFAMTVILNLASHLGAEIVIEPKFELDDVIDLIARRGIRVLPGVPTMFTAMLRHPKASSIDMSSVEVCLSGGAPIPVEIMKAFEATFDTPIREGYGLTECSAAATGNIPGRPGVPGSIGVPIPGTELRILDLENYDREMPVGEKGMIALKGPQVMKGYWNKPAETAEILKDGMLITGDIGYMDEDGFTFIVDRQKDLILVGGFNVYPRIIEEALYEHPSVSEATVIGIPDDYRGERPKAFVSLKTDMPPVTEGELLDFLRGMLGKHEIPGMIEFRAELPKTPVGKLSKKELVEEEKAKYEKSKS